MRQIRSKINIMGKIRHRNLVPLLAHVSHGDCHYLVYEFMKNGSLQDVLDEASNGTKEFDWLARFGVLLWVLCVARVLVIGKKPTNLFFHNMDEICLAK
ncbi:leucine-rich repeat receptor-like serine/threonine/tyrosine-protein kinase sobir1 [Quercus suber]|uniref:non-specific serine/threonine protein kinase n=1 Tax=Quercus suber TaxID=58331 RepID=A0AAW0MBY2_QUESU